LRPCESAPQLSHSGSNGSVLILDELTIPQDKEASMTRTMGDAIAANAPTLATASGLQLVAGYVTGSSDILWTASDWALFPNQVHVTIDQGYTGSPVPSADVRDVETGAWSASGAVDSGPWTAARPTIYCNQSTLPSVLSAGWQGDLWLAIVGWEPGQALPSAPGCNIAAVQNNLDAGGGAYDLSVVLDPYWPLEALVASPQLQDGWAFCSKCNGMFWANGAAAAGTCPAGGQHAVPSGGSNDYSLIYTPPGT
jgi:hypothetical protein